MKPTADNKKRKGIPLNVPPTLERICIPVRVPNDPEYIALFMGTLKRLTDQSLWDRDPLRLAKQVATVWKEVYHQTAESVAMGETCDSLGIPDDGCTTYMPNHPMLSYSPNDPFQTPNQYAPPYALPAWYTNPLIALPGVLPTDAMVNFLAIPIAITLEELFTVGFPRVRIPAQGIGEIELELVRVPQGGIAIVTSDAGFGATKVVDLNSVSIVGLPSVEDILDVVLEDKVNETEILEFHFDTPGAHYVEVQFVPNIGSGVLLGFGGGLRRVSFCEGAETGEIPVPEIRIVNCNLEWRPNPLTVWTNLGNVCGADGEDGQDGAAGASGASAIWPVSAIIAYGGTSEPDGWLFCHGQAVSRSTYDTLFGVIGTSFGAGNGTTTFNVPNIRQRTPRGIGVSSPVSDIEIHMGEMIGEDGITLALEHIPPHSHGIPAKDTPNAFGATNRAGETTSAGTNESFQSELAGGDEGVTVPVNIVPRTIGTEFIICAQDTNDIFAPYFFVQDCVLKWQSSPIAEFVDLVDLSECTEAGLTPQFRMTAIDVDTQAIEMKFTNQPDVPGAWQTIGYVNDGAPGVSGEPENQVWRLISESATRRVLQWRFTSDPDMPASYRTVGAWDIPTSEMCDCPDIPAPGDILDDPDRCKIAWGLANRLSTELVGMIADFDEDFAWPLDLIEALPVALVVLEHTGVFLSRIAEIADYLFAHWNDIPDSTDAALYVTEIADPVNIEAFARIIYAFYDPLYGLTDNHAVIIAATTLASHPANRALLAMAGWLIAPNIEHWQDAVLHAALNDPTQDCTEFELPAVVTAAIFNFEDTFGEIFEAGETYQTSIKLSLSGVATLGTETRVYYTAQDITAANGADYFLPDGFVTFPANATNGTERTLAFSIFDNAAVDGDRSFRVKLTHTVGEGIIGDQPTHQIIIRDNEDFYLVLGGRGTNLQRIDDWTWKADSTPDANFHRVWLNSMNLDNTRCFKLLAVDFEGVSPGETYFNCGSGAAINTRPPTYQSIHALRYQTTTGAFSVIVTIEPD